jgi:alpha-L-fucosidase
MKKLLVYLFLVVTVFACAKPKAKETADPVVLPPVTVVDTSRTSWFEKARFGMFIHWGIYSIPAGIYNGHDMSVDGSQGAGSAEWIMHNLKIPVATYKLFAKQFNPTEYNPEQWVQMAKAAGMKYIVITTKHHEGFALFDSKYSDWNVVKATPYGKDLIRPFVDACRKYGMKIGFYYSQADDWVNTGGSTYDGSWDPFHDGSMDDYIAKVAEPQVREILTKYGDIAELWWDNQGNDMNPSRAAKFLPAVALQPKMIMNDRLGGDVRGDFDTPEQHIAGNGDNRLFESCMTMNNTWGFSEHDNNWKSSQTLIRNLIETSSLGGNFLLNVGPEASGKFPQPIIDRLVDIGKWMKVNSESIYETKASPFRAPFKSLSWGRATSRLAKNGNTILYLHVYNWPANGELLVPGLTNDIISATLLDKGTVIKSTKQSDGVLLNLPASQPDKIATVIKLETKGAIKLDTYVQPPESDGSLVLYPTLANAQNPGGGQLMQAEGDAGNENLGYWTDPKAYVTWMIRVSKPGTYTVTASVASGGGNSVIALTIGTEVIKKQVSGSGDWNDYQNITLGTIKIDNPGTTTVKLSADESDWSPVNVRKITLKP